MIYNLIRLLRILVLSVLKSHNKQVKHFRQGAIIPDHKTISVTRVSKAFGSISDKHFLIPFDKIWSLWQWLLCFGCWKMKNSRGDESNKNCKYQCIQMHIYTAKTKCFMDIIPKRVIFTESLTHFVVRVGERRSLSRLGVVDNYGLWRTWTNKTVGFGAKRILEYFGKSHGMYNDQLLGTDSWLVFFW